jgi:hypothetical protein
MHILYKVTYLPHIDTELPKYYIGSKYNYKGNYFGSVSSNQVYEYTEGIPLKEWWKTQRQFLERLEFEILETYDDITPKELVIKEYNLHIKLNVMSSEYFNHSIATKGWCSVTNSAQTKKLKSDKAKEYWDSDAGQLKKHRLIERNKQHQSNIMKEKWANPTEAMLGAERRGRPKGAKNLTKSKERVTIRKIYADGLIFDNAKDAAIYFSIDPVNIRRRCRLKYKGTWRYLI